MGAIDKESFVPIYYQISNDLKERIISGEYPPGRRLPSEHQLADYYGVNRNTLRQGLDKLHREGFLRRERNRGTFVAPRPTSQRVIAIIMGTYPLEEHVNVRQILSGIVSRLRRDNYLIQIYEADQIPEIIALHREGKLAVDGVIGIRCYGKMSKLLQQVDKAGILYVHEGHDDGLLKRSVTLDHNGGVEKLIDYLWGLGHREFGVLGFEDKPEINPHVFQRAEFARELIQRKSSGCHSGKYDFNFSSEERDAYRPELQSFLKERTKHPTVYVCTGDPIAATLINTALRYGYSIPEDFSVTGYDDYDLAEHLEPSLTTLKQDYFKNGSYAAEMLLKDIADFRKRKWPIIVESKLIIRESTAEPRLV